MPRRSTRSLLAACLAIAFASLHPALLAAQDYDLVIDGSDNFETRYLVNDACYLAGKTNVHGSIFQFEGMDTVFAPTAGRISAARSTPASTLTVRIK